jgi:hypothetical protein
MKKALLIPILITLALEVMNVTYSAYGAWVAYQAGTVIAVTPEEKDLFNQKMWSALDAVICASVIIVCQCIVLKQCKTLTKDCARQASS